ncbi:hypothetical protein ABDJ41_02765 [Pedobacter sp. ASV1-7]|uniref:hypothetical protein n=1 Tax=Pedobacter sp. ASV1-7 TaxID=3145237 RepID=UPI0032E8605A
MKRITISMVFLLFILPFTSFSQENKLYAKFPESFESDNKLNYQIDDVNLPSGTWRLDNAVIQSQKYENPTSGTHALRMAMNHTTSAYAQMMFDLPNGASRVSFWYKCFALDKPSMCQLEYSTDKGRNWHAVGDLIVATNKNKYTEAVFDLEIEGRVRFRINKIGLGDGSKNPDISNGRLNIDDFAVYHK